jgi:hypothetical protein
VLIPATRLAGVTSLKIDFEDDEASTVVQILVQLAALIDPDDPYGLRDTFGRPHPQQEALVLRDEQFRLLRVPAYDGDERADVASTLRVIAARIYGQLPPDALEPLCKNPS